MKNSFAIVLTHLRGIAFRMIQISENAGSLTDVYRKEHASIPWRALYGLRNRIVHDYGHVDLSIVYSTLKKDIPDLLEKIRAL